MPERILECAFLVPVVRDSDRQPHGALAWRMLQEALFVLFRGYTGAESVYRLDTPVPGAYEDEGTSRRVEDQSLRYIVAVDRKSTRLNSSHSRASRMPSSA